MEEVVNCIRAMNHGLQRLAALPPSIASRPKLDSDARRALFLFELYLHLAELPRTGGD